MLEKFGISEGIFLAVVTAGLYAFCYAFESGYLAYYRIPASYIEISISSILPAILNSIIYIVFVSLWLSIIISGMQGRHYSVKLISTILFITWIFPAIYFLDLGGKFINGAMYTIVGYAFFMFALSKIEEKNKKFQALSRLYFKKFMSPRKSDKEDPEHLHPFQKLAFTILIVGAPLYLAYTAGYSRASSESVHNIVRHSDHGSSIVVGVYGNKILLAPYDHYSASLHGTYFSSTLNGISEALIERKNTGKLKR